MLGFNLRRISAAVLAATAFAGLGASAATSESLAQSTTPTLNYSTSWFGNTFSGLNSKWVPHGLQSMFVTPDGTAYTNVGWEEGGKEVAGFKNGTVYGTHPDLHGGGLQGGQAITADAKYIFAGCKRSGWKIGVCRYPRAQFDTASGARLTPTFMPLGANAAGADSGANGMAVYGNELFVANPRQTPTGGDQRLSEATRIEVFDATAMNGAVKRSWAVPRARQMAFDGDGYLWVLQQRNGSTAPRIVRYDRNGKLMPQQITGIADPISLAVSGTRLLVGDNGRDQNIKIYKNVTATPALEKTFGTTGGYLAGPRPGAQGPLRFDGPKGVGIDAAGNIYVASIGVAGVGERIWSAFEIGRQVVLESYKPDGTRNWRLEGLEWCDRGSVDPGSETTVFTRDEQFTLDYTKPAGQQATHKAHTLDPFKYPNDPRIQRAGDRESSDVVWTRRFSGRRFMFMTGGLSGPPGYMAVYRFSDADDIAIPAGSVPLTSTSSAGVFPDSKGNVWEATRTSGIRRFRMTGLDASGNPVYSKAAMDSYPMPAPFSDVRRVQYEPATDTLYLAGYTGSLPDNRSYSSWKSLGRVIARYDNWTAGNRKAKYVVQPTPWTTGLQNQDGGGKPVSMSVAGDYLFVGWITDRPSSSDSAVRVYRASDGAYVGIFDKRPGVGTVNSWLDLYDAIEATRRPNGEYVLITEENSRQKNMLYRWKP